MRDYNTQSNPRTLVESDSSFAHEMMTEEHVPYQIILMNGIEAVRRGIEFSSDGGLRALLSLYSILTTKIRNQFPGLDRELFEALRLKKTKKMRMSFREPLADDFLPDYTHFDVASGKIVTEKQRTFKSSCSASSGSDFNYSEASRRAFASRKLIGIIDVLEAEGILWRSRLEIVGGEK